MSLIAQGAACGGLDPIVSPDATVDAMSLDASSGDAPGDADGGDVGDADSGSALDGSDAIAPFTCGKIVCDSKTHYCEKKSGVGDAGADGGKDSGVEVDTCVAYPANCVDDGGKASCACITEPCACTQSGEQITVTCP